MKQKIKKEIIKLPIDSGEFKYTTHGIQEVQNKPYYHMTRHYLYFANDSKVLLCLLFDHVQDCCEEVYPDIDASLEDIKDLVIKDSLIIEYVPDYGIRINGAAVACYNDQNGCYGDDLTLTIRYKPIDSEGCTLLKDTELQELKAIKNII